jgi:hypothetical protein
MPKIDAIDEAIIDAPLKAVYKAVMNEYSGVTKLWTPFLECKPRGDAPMDREGEICDITIRKYGMKPKFSDKFIKTNEGKSIELELTGDLIGNETWTFEPIDGKTKVRIHWKGGTNRLLFSLMSAFMSAEKVHSDICTRAFNALNTYLSKNESDETQARAPKIRNEFQIHIFYI